MIRRCHFPGFGVTAHAIIIDALIIAETFIPS